MMPVKLKRVYDKPDPVDGERILVDRLWPRGLSRDRASVNLWMKELAPSGALRTWFGHKAERWDEFRRRYGKELESPDRSRLLNALQQRARRHVVTLVFAAKDVEHNNAAALAELINYKRKGPTAGKRTILPLKPTRISRSEKGRL